MTNHNTEIILGNKYSHRHSKIKGTAMSINFYLYGCSRVGILPDTSTDNNWLYFDENELKGINGKDLGGPRQDCPQGRG